MTSTTPTAVRVEKTAGTGVEIDWSDGHKSAYPFQYLRDACPCATCDDEREKSGAAMGEAPKKKAAALPMYKEPMRPNTATPVGKYAISFEWNDGHHTGIYSWEYLRMMCPCAECKATREAGGKLVPGGSGAIFR